MPTGEPTVFYEDIEVGSEQRSDWYEIERDEVIEFAARWDPYPHHLSDEGAAASMFGRIAACTAHMFAISTRLSHDLPGPLAMMAGLGGDGMNMLAPLYAGTRVRLRRRYLEARESASRPGVGIVRLEDCLENEEGDVLFQTAGSLMVAKRSR